MTLYVDIANQVTLREILSFVEHLNLEEVEKGYGDWYLHYADTIYTNGTIGDILNVSVYLGVPDLTLLILTKLKVVMLLTDSKTLANKQNIDIDYVAKLANTNTHNKFRELIFKKVNLNIEYDNF
jgi:hypothetical protein